MMKRIVCILLVLALSLSLLPACGTETAETVDPVTSVSEVETQESAAETVSEAPQEVPAASNAEDSSEDIVIEAPASEYVPLELPLTDEDVTLSLWLALKPFLLAYNVDVNNLTFFREMERRTGVSLDITSVAIFAASESFNLMVASGEYPDLIDSFQVFYTGSADSAIEQDIVVDLMDYLDEYMPNYRAALDSQSTFWMDSLTQEGALPSANMLFAKDEGATIGMIIREDWLNEVEMDVPVTYDDMENVLAAFKNTYGIGALGLNSYGQGWGVSAGMGVRDLDTSDVSKAAFLNIDGKVSYSPATEEYRDYMELLHDWYEKGYIWPDFISQSGNVSEYLASSVIGVTTAERDYIQTVTDMLQVDDPDAGLIGIRALRKEPDEVLHISYFIESIIYGTAISATSEHKELAAQWLDYCYSPDGQLLTNYGIEGEGLQFDTDGNPCYTDMVLHNESYGVTAASAIFSQYGGAMLCYADRTFEGYSERIQEAIENWRYDTQDWMYPTKVTLTTEQGEAYTPIINELNNYVAEASLKFILGDTELNDETWDSYLTTLENMGLSEAVQIKQDALAVYLRNA